MNKLAKMTRFVPSLYRPTINPKVRGLLAAWAIEDDNVYEQIQNAKEQIFVKMARLQYLDALGSNVGVFRPTEFNLADEQYRELIPALSFYPKQVLPTIKKILSIFFGTDNPTVLVKELNPNEIFIQIPSSVSSLRRTLKGSHHFHAYQGEIVSIDLLTKEMVVNLSHPSKSLKEDELALGSIGVGLKSEVIASNSAGNQNVIFQFYTSANLTQFNVGDKFNCINPHYPGSFFANPTRPYTVTKQRGILGQNVSAGDIITVLNMNDASSIPDEQGYLCFNFGFGNEEGLIKYFGRPNNSTLLLDPLFTFSYDHSVGEPVNFIVTPYINPSIDGSDYSVFLVGVTAARILAQKIIESIVAAGVVIRWSIIEPTCRG